MKLQLLKLLFQVNNAKTEKDLEEINLENFSDALVSAGWVKPLNIGNKDLAMWQLVVHETLLKRKTPLDQFIAGLKSFNLLHIIKSHPELLRPYFTHMDNRITREKVISLFNLGTGSNDEPAEKSKGYFIQAISDLEEGMNCRTHKPQCY